MANPRSTIVLDPADLASLGDFAHYAMQFPEVEDKEEEVDLAAYLESISNMRLLVDKTLLKGMLNENNDREVKNEKKPRERGYWYNPENATIEMKLADRLQDELIKIKDELKQKSEGKLEEKKTTNRLQSKFNTTRGWADDILTLLTDGFRIKNQDLITDSTYLAGFNSLWNIGHTYFNPNVDSRKIRLSIDSLKFLIMLTTTIINKIVAANPTIHTLLTAITVLNFFLEVVKKYYIVKELNNKYKLESTELKIKNKEINTFTTTNKIQDKTIDTYQQQFTLYHDSNLKELEIAIFGEKRDLVFAVVGFVGAVLMPGGVFVWGVALTGSGLIAGATFFEFIDRQLDYCFTKKIKKIPERVYTVAGSTVAYVQSTLNTLGKRVSPRGVSANEDRSLSSLPHNKNNFAPAASGVPATLLSKAADESKGAVAPSPIEQLSPGLKLES